MSQGHPEAYWLSGFFFPHGFMTGILQTFSRKYHRAIDFLKFKFIIQHNESYEKPEDGVMIYGLYLEQAQWDSVNQTLVE